MCFMALQEFFKYYADTSSPRPCSDEDNKMDLLSKGSVISNHTHTAFWKILKAEGFKSDPDIFCSKLHTIWQVCLPLCGTVFRVEPEPLETLKGLFFVCFFICAFLHTVFKFELGNNHDIFNGCRCGCYKKR